MELTLKDRIQIFSKLGDLLSNEEELKEWARDAYNQNNWFNEENVLSAIKGIKAMLTPNTLEKWLGNYKIQRTDAKKVGIIAAGNIPLVSFHDIMCVLLTGHIAVIKASSQDSILIKRILMKLTELEPSFQEQIVYADQLKNIDAVIATGSDNSSRYFEYYFSKMPHIIRKNRVSVAVLTGEESESDLGSLGKDILDYYGLGCRNVSKIYVPEDYIFNFFFESIEKYSSKINHHKYRNNYDYNRTIYMLNQVVHLDNGFLLLTENKELVSPISVLYFERYKNIEDVKVELESKKEKLQVIVSLNGTFPNSIPFGTAQCPMPWDYADGVDTIQFLLNI
ncbi:MAG TPA: acyl-CoA reductase [Cytophagaceae bacterium]|jgi:hypothetical protein